jgi:DNA-binding NarL/FixJ family response regulator
MTIALDRYEPYTAGDSGQPIRVAIVDDHPLVLEGLARALARGGMEVIGAFVDGPSVLAFLASYEADLLVVDLRLPPGSGISVIQEARRRYPALKLALLTSSDEPVAAVEAVRAGASGVLVKASTSTEIVRQLTDVARGNLVLNARVAAAVLDPRDLLTPQELTVLDLVADGLTNKEIGARLNLSHHTVKDYLTRAMRKVDANTRAEAVNKAAQRGLLSRR